MKKLICDCCGKDIITNIGAYDNDELQSRLTRFDDFEDGEFDLCKNCTKDVIDFIKYRPLWINER